MKVLLALLLALPAYADIVNVPASGTPDENGEDLMDAWTAASCGDVITLEAGGSYRWAFEYGFLLRNKECAGNPIYIESDELAMLPEGTRIGISDKAHMPKILATWPGFGSISQPAISIGDNVSGLIIRGLEVLPDESVPYANILIFMCNDTSSVEMSELPEYVTFDRMYVHSHEDEVRSGYGTAGSAFFACGNHIDITNSRIAVPAGMYSYPDTTVNNQYGVAIGNGSYFTIHNNYCLAWYACNFVGGYQFPDYNEATISAADLDSATFSNVTNLNIGDLVSIHQDTNYWGAVQITGISGLNVSYEPYGLSNNPAGGSPLTGVPMFTEARWEGHIPNHITITQNTFDIDSDVVDEIFDLTGNSSKGWLEWKAGNDTVFDGNDFIGRAAGIGFNIRNQGTPSGAWSVWSTMSRMEFTNNRIHGTGGPFRFTAILEDPTNTSTPGTDWLIQNNLFIADIGEGGWFDFGSGSNIRVIHNTILSYDSSSTGWSIGVLGFATEDDIEWRDNIFAEGQGALCTVDPFTCLNGMIAGMDGNVIIEEVDMGMSTTCGGTYPSGNFCVDAEGDVGFDANYALDNGSPFKGMATDATDPGIDYAALLAALGGTAEPDEGTPVSTSIGRRKLRLKFRL